jgi:hypothetical protein
MVYKFVFSKLLEFGAIALVSTGLIIMCIVFFPFALFIALLEWILASWRRNA